MATQDADEPPASSADDETATRGIPGDMGDDPEAIRTQLIAATRQGGRLADRAETLTVSVAEDIDEDEFFSTANGTRTVVDRYDLERAVPAEQKRHFEEVERYWVNKPYAFVVIFHSRRENEYKYYLIEPHNTDREIELREFLTEKLRRAIKYTDEAIATDETDREAVIERETYRLLDRYDLYTGPTVESGDSHAEDDQPDGLLGRLAGRLPFGNGTDDKAVDGAEARPDDAVDADPSTLTPGQVQKLLYYLKRDFLGYERIDGIKHDINVEDVSCDGYNAPVFVYHTEYEQIITNVSHGEQDLDDFVVKLAQRSGKGISKRRPQVDATLPDGSRAQLTLGNEVSDHGTNYTIRQFKDVPFTPIDLINWRTISLEQMAFLWLAIENNKSILFAGGTASGKTTTLNAVSLFIPSNTKIVSIEDTREVELPQRNWVASVTRPSFSGDEVGDIDEFDLLEAALRQRPDYIIMGEVRGEEGRTLFQIMSTGHTTYTTFHADSVGEVLKRFTTDPINVSKTMFTALDLVSIQTQTRVRGKKVRRVKELTEVNHYDAEDDQINVRQVYQWQAETDRFRRMGRSDTLEDIKFDRGWSQERLDQELFERRVVLAYLVDRGISEYAKVAATIQAFITDPEAILTLIATEQLEASLSDLMEMESVEIQIDPEKEAVVPRPEPTESDAELARSILEEAERSLFEEYRETDTTSTATLVDALEATQSATDADDADTSVTTAEGGIGS